MKIKLTAILVLIFFQIKLPAQRLNIGIVNGINISDINSNTNSGNG